MPLPSAQNPAQARPLGSPAFESLTVNTRSDGFLEIPAAMFSNLEPADLALLSPRTRFGANTWRIETGARTLLVDAGSGRALQDRFPSSGNLNWQADTKQSERDAVTDIIITHMHADHIGGLSAEGTCLFPNARLHLQATEWRFWTDEGLLAKMPEARRPMVQMIQTLAAPLAAQIVLHEGEADLGAGITLLPAPGHTPGHQIVHLSDGPHEALLLADAVVSGAVQFQCPEIEYALDIDPKQAAATRRDLFDRIAADGIPFAATHLDTQAFGTLDRQPQGYRFHQIL